MKRKQKQKWDSVCLQHMGLQTDLNFIHLVEEAKSLMLFQQKHQRPAERKHESMRAASEGGLLVKLPHLRSIPESDDKSRHLAAALEIQFPKEEGRYKISANCVQAVDYILAVDAAKLANKRQTQVKRFEILARKCQGWDKRMKQHVKSPETVQVLNKNINVALVAVLIEAMDYPDKKLPLQLLEGLPICGDIDYDSGVYRPNPSEENAGVFNIRFEEWNKTHDAWFVECSAQLSRAAERARREALAGDRTRLDTLHKIDRATKLEVQKGLMGPSLSEQELRVKYESNGALTCRIIPRFPVFQGSTDKRCAECDLETSACQDCKGLQMPKLRCCDNAKASGTNANTRLCENITGPTFEFPARVCAYIAAECARKGISRPEVLLGLDDLFAAFRRVPSSQPEFTIVALYEFDSDSVRFHEVFGMNFGLKAAPLQFNRVAELLCAVASCFGALPVDHYYDDFLLLCISGSDMKDPCQAGTVWPSSGQWALARFCAILGWPVEPKKRKDAGTENGILGVHADLRRFQAEGIISFRPTEKRVSEILRDLRWFREQGSLEPAEAASCQGRLYFTLSSAYASVGRAAIQPLIDRGACNSPKKGSRPWPWTESMTHMLRFYEALFPNLPPLIFDFLKRKREKVVIYTDASCSWRHYGLGIIIIIDGRRWYLNSFAPQWILDAFKTRTHSMKIINQLELLAILCAVLTFGRLLEDRRVWFWCDNCAALSGAIHGYARAPHLAQLSNEIHLRFAALQISAWFEWVPTECNIADIPSRPQGPEEYDFYARESFERWPGEMVFPSSEKVKSHDLDLLKWRTSEDSP